MSNTVAHLVVAKRIIGDCPQLVDDVDAFYLGNVAPDTIGSKRDCSRDDKKRVHLRSEIRDTQWLNSDQMAIFNSRVSEFVHRYIENAKGGQRDFNMGYLVHLLTDKWNHKTIRQTMLAVAHTRNVMESDREFFYMMTNDLEALDNYLLNRDEEVGEILSRLLNQEVRYSLEGYIDREYIEGSIRWWKNSYLVNIKRRELKYIDEKDITEFIDTAVREVVKELRTFVKDAVF